MPVIIIKIAPQRKRVNHNLFRTQKKWCVHCRLIICLAIDGLIIIDIFAIILLSDSPWVISIGYFIFQKHILIVILYSKINYN